MCAASVLIGLSAVCIRELSGTFNTFQLVFFRSAVGLLLLGPWMFRTARLGTLSTRRLPLYLIRTVLSYTGMVCVFYGLGQNANWRGLCSAIFGTHHHDRDGCLCC